MQLIISPIRLKQHILSNHHGIHKRNSTRSFSITSLSQVFFIQRLLSNLWFLRINFHLVSMIQAVILEKSFPDRWIFFMHLFTFFTQFKASVKRVHTLRSLQSSDSAKLINLKYDRCFGFQRRRSLQSVARMHQQSRLGSIQLYTVGFVWLDT